jgi:hypothetical protein
LWFCYGSFFDDRRWVIVWTFPFHVISIYSPFYFFRYLHVDFNSHFFFLLSGMCSKYSVL